MSTVAREIDPLEIWDDEAEGSRLWLDSEMAKIPMYRPPPDLPDMKQVALCFLNMIEKPDEYSPDDINNTHKLLCIMMPNFNDNGLYFESLFWRAREEAETITLNNLACYQDNKTKHTTHLNDLVSEKTFIWIQYPGTTVYEVTAYMSMFCFNLMRKLYGDSPEERADREDFIRKDFHEMYYEFSNRKKPANAIQFDHSIFNILKGFKGLWRMTLERSTRPNRCRQEENFFEHMVRRSIEYAGLKPFELFYRYQKVSKTNSKELQKLFSQNRVPIRELVETVNRYVQIEAQDPDLLAQYEQYRGATCKFWPYCRALNRFFMEKWDKRENELLCEELQWEVNKNERMYSSRADYRADHLRPDHLRASSSRASIIRSSNHPYWRW